MIIILLVSYVRIGITDRLINNNEESKFIIIGFLLQSMVYTQTLTYTCISSLVRMSTDTLTHMTQIIIYLTQSIDISY